MDFIRDLKSDDVKVVLSGLEKILQGYLHKRMKSVCLNIDFHLRMFVTMSH